MILYTWPSIHNILVFFLEAELLDFRLGEGLCVGDARTHSGSLDCSGGVVSERWWQNPAATCNQGIIPVCQKPVEQLPLDSYFTCRRISNRVRGPLTSL